MFGIFKKAKKKLDDAMGRRAMRRVVAGMFALLLFLTGKQYGDDVVNRAGDLAYEVLKFIEMMSK